MNNTQGFATPSEYESNRGVMSIAIIPCPIIVLPEGRLRLTIYQPEYLSLIAKTCKEDSGFVLAFCTREQIVSLNRGIYVRIVNFNKDDQDRLLIDVEGQHLVSLTEVEQAPSGIWYGNSQFESHWTTINHSEVVLLTQSLLDLFEQYVEVAMLYSSFNYNRVDWVCSRLIELLPIPYDVKMTFLKPDSFESVIHFLITILKKEKKL